MVVKKCNRRTASKILRQLRKEERIPELEMVAFGRAGLDGPQMGPSSWGGSHPEAAADVRQR